MESSKIGYHTNLSYAHHHPTGWRVSHAETGTFLRTLEDDHILCRVANGAVFLYDRQRKREVEISLEYLNWLAG